MPTVLLLDHDILFKAVEGTCLRQERCRLVTASPERAIDMARDCRADLILACLAGKASQKALTSILSSKHVATVPVLVIAFEETGVSDLSDGSQGRDGPVEFLTVQTDARGKLNLRELDTRLDAAIKRQVPWMDRQADRVRVDLRVVCRGRGISGTMRTKNISPSGLFLKTEDSLTPGRRFEVSFSLPSESDDDVARVKGRLTITGECEIVRHVGRGCDDAQDDLIPGIGVRFLELGKSERHALKRFVQLNVMPAAGRSAVATQ